VRFELVSDRNYKRTQLIMSEVRLNLLDALDAIQGTIHGSVADAVIASLSAEPETIAELEAALERFNKRIDDRSPFASFAAGENTEPWDAGVVVVDLAARIVASESSYSALLAEGEVNYHDGNEATDTWLPYRLPEDWLFLTSVLEYEALRSTRRAVRSTAPVIDIRETLYGRAIFEFIVAECLIENAKLDGLEGSEGDPEINDRPGLDGRDQLERSRLDGGDELHWSEPDGGDELEDSSRFAAVLRDVHARWLMTSRNELGGRTPREVILEKREFIAHEIDSRAMQWSLLGEAPPPLSRDSRAYRFAGFGTHEYVIYYDFVRHLLTQCWERISQELSDKNAKPEAHSGEVHSGEAQSGAEASISVGAGSGSSIAVGVGSGSAIAAGAGSGSAEHPRWRVALLTWLEQVGQAWLNDPNEDLDGRIPAAIIESERTRIPLVMAAKDIMVDENCDLCRMLAHEASHSGPAFWHLDGSDMDPGFEFSTYLTREEFEAEQRRWKEFNEEFERKWSAEHPKLN
jgi:hypothetical protein